VLEAYRKTDTNQGLQNNRRKPTGPSAQQTSDIDTLGSESKTINLRTYHKIHPHCHVVLRSRMVEDKNITDSYI